MVVGEAASGPADGTIVGVEPASVGVVAGLEVTATGDELPPLFVGDGVTGMSTGPITGDEVVGVAPAGKSTGDGVSSGLELSAPALSSLGDGAIVPNGGSEGSDSGTGELVVGPGVPGLFPETVADGELVKPPPLSIGMDTGALVASPPLVTGYGVGSIVGLYSPASPGLGVPPVVSVGIDAGEFTGALVISSPPFTTGYCVGIIVVEPSVGTHPEGLNVLPPLAVGRSDGSPGFNVGTAKGGVTGASVVPPSPPSTGE